MACSAHPSGLRSFVIIIVVAFAAALHAQTAPVPVPGRNVNLSSGPAELNTTVSPPIIRGDFLLKQQNEGSCAMSSRNPKNILCGANDYRLIDVPGVDPGDVTRDAWGGVFQSANYGDTWESTVLPGHYLDPAPSLLKSFKAMADPVVRSGAAGVTYMSGIAFKGPNDTGIVYLATFLDLNNKENDPTPFKLIRITPVDTGNSGQFIDKPWQVVLPPEGAATCTITLPDPVHAGQTITQTIPDSPVILGYSIFVGNPTDTYRTKQMLARVTGCGANVERRVKVSESQKINQAMTIAVSPTNPKKIVAVWRRFADGAETNALLSSVSNDGGLTWTKPIVTAQLGLICPFDQNATAVKFRTQSFPTMAAGPDGVFYLAWADRGKGSTGACLASGPSRIVLSSSSDGVNWTAPAAIDPVAYGAHQVNPSLTVAGNTLHLLWQDMRDSASGYFLDPFINEMPLLRAAAKLQPEVDHVPAPVRHNTIEIYSRMATLNGGGGLTWGPSVQVSQYKKGAYKDKSGNYHYGQIQWNIPNLRLFAKALKAFDGDYVDAATPPMLPPAEGRPNWTFDVTGQRDPFFFSVWTDNRDVRRSPAQQSTDETVATPYTPAGRSGTSLADPTQQCPTCVPGSYQFPGTMNQNLYGARINRGFVAYAPGNNKRIRVSTEFGVEFQRAYVVMVRNDSSETKAFHLTIPVQYQTFDGGSSSFTQLPPAVYQLLVTVPKHSSASRTVFIIPDGIPTTPVPTNAKVRVDVTEVIGGADVPGGASVYINPDPTAPEVEAPEVEAPEVEAKEVYAPEVEAPEVEAPEVEAPEVEAPEVEAPEVEAPEVEAPEVEATSYMSPEVEAPEVEAPEVEAPEVEAPEVEATAITDIVWPMKNGGNTTAGYIFQPKVSGDLTGYDFQLIVSRIVKAPGAKQCVPGQTTMNRVAVLVDANRLVRGETIDPEDADYATAWVNPQSERVLVTLRVRAFGGVPPFSPAQHPTSLAITQEAIDTERLIAGDTTPPVVIVNAIPSLEFAATPSTATSTRPLAPAVTVRVRNQFGEVLPGIAVTLALGSAPSGATLGGTTVATTNADGVATFTNLIITGAGESFTLVASALDAAPVTSAPFMVLAACAADGVQTTYSSTVGDMMVETNPLASRPANFDGDGHPDLVVIHGSGRITLMQGNGLGGFEERLRLTIPAMPTPTALAVADLNEDGYDDIIVVDEASGRLGVVLSNNSAGPFVMQPAVTIPVGGARSIVAGEFVGADGHADVAVAATSANLVTVFRGDGQGNLATPGIASDVASPGPMATGDLNGDGNADLAVINESSGSVVVLAGDGAGHFRAVESEEAGSSPVAVAIGDMENDGYLDVIVANEGDPGVPAPGDVRELRGDGTGALTLRSDAWIVIGGAPSSVAVGDWNSDGFLDIAVPDRTYLEMVFSDGGGGFRPPRTFITGVDPIEVWAADVTEDGRTDLIITSHRLSTVIDVVNVLVNTCGATTANLVTTVADTPDPSPAGGPITYTVTVRNLGPFAATAVTVDGTFSGVFDSVVAPPECSGGAQMTCALGTIERDQSVSLTITVLGGLPPRVNAEVTARASEVDPGPGNNVANQTTTITAVPLTFVVTTTADAGLGSLRDAITRANLNAPARDAITFNIQGAGVQTITPLTALPAVSDSVVLDAGTQPGYLGSPLIELNGASAGSSNGLTINGANSVVRGFAINRFGRDGVSISASNNTVSGNFIGTNAAGSAALPNVGSGIAVQTGTSNTIGGSVAGAGNVISGNQLSGLRVLPGSSGTIVSGNYIGLNAAGTGAIPNIGDGLQVSGTAVIGGTTPAARNVISGNTVMGLAIFDPASGITVTGNYIGTNAAGTLAVANGSAGISIANSPNNLVGGSAAGARNLISGNFASGVSITGTTSTDNVIEGNRIGTNVDGMAALPNGGNGVSIQNTANSRIRGNLLSGNANFGVHINGPTASGQLVTGNLIGTNATGDGPLPNTSAGIAIETSAHDNVIGGTTPADRNIISGNTGPGVRIFFGAHNNTIQGNYIGTNPGGMALVSVAGPCPGCNGITINASNTNTIGGIAPGAGNLIAGNVGAGAEVGGSGNIVVGNVIGLDAASAALPNATGVSLTGTGNRVGGTTASERNVISGNTNWGVVVILGNNHTISGNYIGTDPTGLLPRGNGESGVLIESNSSGNVVGGEAAGAANVISGNAGSGVRIVHAGSLNNSVLGNFIGLDASTFGALPNAREGVRIENGASSNVVGSLTAPNFIAYNGWAGISVTVDSGAWGTGNAFTRNAIHSNGGLGIDLRGDGVTANDPLDADTGPNNMQNYPVITSASSNGSTTDIAGTLASTPSTTFTIDHYVSDSCDSSGFGQGQTWVERLSGVSSDGAGQLSYTISLGFGTAAGRFITATATDAAGNTSEFSACQPVTTGAIASLRVAVRDATDAVMPGVAVTLTNLGTAAVRTASTDAIGVAYFANLTPGSYRASTGVLPTVTVDVTLAEGDSPLVFLRP